MGFIRSIFGTGTVKVTAGNRDNTVAGKDKSEFVVGGAAAETGFHTFTAPDGGNHAAAMQQVRRHVDMSEPHDDDMANIPLRGRHARRTDDASNENEKQAYADAISRLSISGKGTDAASSSKEAVGKVSETIAAKDEDADGKTAEATVPTPVSASVVPVIDGAADEGIAIVHPTVETIEDADVVEVAIADDGTVAAVEDIKENITSEASVPDEILPSDKSTAETNVPENGSELTDEAATDASDSPIASEDGDASENGNNDTSSHAEQHDEAGEGMTDMADGTNGEAADEAETTPETCSEETASKEDEDTEKQDDGQAPSTEASNDSEKSGERDADADGRESSDKDDADKDVKPVALRPSRAMLESMVPDIDSVTSAATVPEGYGDVVLADCVDTDDPSVASDPFYAYSRAELDEALRTSCKTRRKALGKEDILTKVENDGQTGVWLPKTVLAAMPAEVLRGILRDKAVANMSRKYGILEYAQVKGARMEMRCPSPSGLAEMLLAYPVIRTARKSVSDGAYPAVKEGHRKTIATALGHAAKRIERAVVVMCDASVLDDLDDDLADAVEAYAVIDGKRAMESGMKVVKGLVG